MKVRKIIIAGGTGFIGQLLIDYWQYDPIDLVILTRKPQISHEHIRYVVWDGETLGEWVSEFDGADILINLAGKSVDCRYTERNKRLIMGSRVNSTRILGEAIRQCPTPPRLWINSASATIYRHATDRQMDEYSGETDHDRWEFLFSEQVCKAWERAFWEAPTPTSVRKVALRMAIVLGRRGGVWPVLKRLAYLGLGGPMGRGDQFISWLHERDLIHIIDFIIDNQAIAGTYNGSSPNPVRNRDFMALLRQTLRIPIGLPAYEWMLKIGAILLRTEPELVLKSRNVVSLKLLEAGFQFEFPDLEMAIAQLATSSKNPQPLLQTPGSASLRHDYPVQ